MAGGWRRLFNFHLKYYFFELARKGEGRLVTFGHGRRGIASGRQSFTQVEAQRDGAADRPFAHFAVVDEQRRDAFVVARVGEFHPSTRTDRKHLAPVAAPPKAVCKCVYGVGRYV